MGKSFYDKHKYIKGTYEGKLQALGYNVEELRKKSGGWGNNMNPGEFQKITSQFKSPYATKMEGYDTDLKGLRGKQENLLGDKFQWDYKDYLPGIQNEASSIFDPQQAQLDAMRQLGRVQYDQTKIETMEQFDKRFQAETEAINSRGAYFSGGAIQNEQNIRTENQRALNMQTLQWQASDFGMQAQGALLGAEKTKYVKDQLIDNQASAYNRWFNERGFQFGALQSIYSQVAQERDFSRGVFESDRGFNEQVRQFTASYDLSMKQFELTKKKFKETKKQYGSTLAWQKFKYFDSKKKSKKVNIDHTPNLSTSVTSSSDPFAGLPG